MPASFAPADLLHSLRKEWRAAAETRSPISLGLVRFDDFSAIEARYGSETATECMRRIFVALHWVLSRNGDVLCRSSDREFGIVFPHTELGGATFVTARAKALVAALEAPPGVDLALSVSTGVASLTAAGDQTVQMLVEAARGALHRGSGASRAHG